MDSTKRTKPNNYGRWSMHGEEFLLPWVDGNLLRVPSLFLCSLVGKGVAFFRKEETTK